jgi:hypothetical protein
MEKSMKVTFTHKSGRQQEMHERFAIPLQKLGRGTYVARDMRASEVPALEVVETPPPPAVETSASDAVEKPEPKPAKRRARKNTEANQE